MSSPAPENELRLDDAPKAWDDLAARIESFVAAWDAESDPPRLGEYLPDEPPTLRHLTLVELIKVDLEYRWLHSGLRRHVEVYVEEFPELDRAGVPCDLLYEEYHVRKQAGDSVDPHEFFERFPRQADDLARLLGMESSEATTSLFRGEIPADVDVGQQFDDFDILNRLGKGAFASVYLARQRSMQRLVALKVSADRGLEPQTLAQLDHNHIVRVFDQRVLPERGLRLLYMQYVPGGTLQGIIEHAREVPSAERTGGTLLDAVDRALEARGELVPDESSQRARLARLSWPATVCWVGARLARALDYAHRRGVLHRDVKPANVLVTAEGSPKLVDFNVSCSTKLEGANPAAYFGGSLAYMSPEQLDACNPSHPRPPESLDGRSDIYCLGVLLWEMLTGTRPFRDERLEGDWSETLRKMAERRRSGVERAALDQLPGDCPEALRDVLLQSLAPELEARFTTAGDLARQLELCMRPRTLALLRPPQNGWRKLALRLPVVTLLVAAFIPNLLAAIFNFYYNYSEIVTHLQAGSSEVFWRVQTAINATAFPLGHMMAAALMWPVARGLRHLGRKSTVGGTGWPGQSEARPGTPEDASEAPGHPSVLPQPPHRLDRRRPGGTEPGRPLRRRCLLMGHYVAAISLSLWAVAGALYPSSLRLASVAIQWSENLHFVASLVLCGLIAAAFPFFWVTYLATRVWYPALLRDGAPHPDELSDVHRVNRILWRYLLTAASVPMLAVTALVLIDSHNQLAMGILAAGGLAGFMIAFWLYRAIQMNLAALVPALDLTEQSGGGEQELEGSVLAS